MSDDSFGRKSTNLSWASDPSRWKPPAPRCMVVRSRTLCDRAVEVVVSSLCEFRQACPDAHPEDLELVTQAYRLKPHLLLKLYPGR
jgi:hypothetical protein